MLTVTGTHFPPGWQYGPEEIHIFDSTAQQVDKQFPNDRNLVINTTWFGSQFENGEWQRALSFGADFDNLFLLSVIDPLYLTDEDLEILVNKYNIKQVYRIGMFEGSKYEWNFHALIGKDLMPNYTEEQVLMQDPEYIYMLYQRKPRYHRIEITEILRQRDLLKHGIVTLGGPDGTTDWQGGIQHWEPITIEDYPQDYHHDGSKEDFAGVPSDLVTVGRLDLWQKHFLNIISETVFDEWEPLLVTEKMWKATIGLRPYIVHGNPKTYDWMRNHGFKTFNNYWSHIPVETSTDDHGAHDSVWKVIEFLQTQDLKQMYLDMLPDLRYNKLRFDEFSREQKHKMENIFD
jgi:hypothetical protein